MILGDLGADVIKIEPPEGSASRRLGPFLDNIADPERSLQFYAYNRNKRSVVIDPRKHEDQALLVDLIRGADIVLESSPPGWLSGCGFNFEAMCALNPTLVHVVVSPFGVDGPAAGRVANDLTLSALGGQVGLLRSSR
jgi:crotonobetainyl-CoA:carnitine CoA-transferase CaiB-like acyl-CoA transferase